jgi:hypothetical protein
VEAPQGVELTGTNRPRTCHTHPPPAGWDPASNKEKCASTVRYLNQQPHTPPVRCEGRSSGSPPEVRQQVHSVTAAMARGKRPATFRTRKLSLSAPMVLPRGRGGRVGRRRTTIPEGPPPFRWGPFAMPGVPRSSGRKSVSRAAGRGRRGSDLRRGAGAARHRRPGRRVRGRATDRPNPSRRRSTGRRGSGGCASSPGR